MNQQYRLLSEECDQLREQMEETERHVERLQNTLCALAREVGDVRVRHACTQCHESFMLARNGTVYCPQCGSGRSM